MSKSREERDRVYGNIRALLMQNPVKPEHIPAFVEVISWIDKQLPKPKKPEGEND